MDADKIPRGNKVIYYQSLKTNIKLNFSTLCSYLWPEKEFSNFIIANKKQKISNFQ